MNADNCRFGKKTGMGRIAILKPKAFTADTRIDADRKSACLTVEKCGYSEPGRWELLLQSCVSTGKDLGKNPPINTGSEETARIAHDYKNRRELKQNFIADAGQTVPADKHDDTD